MPLPAAEDELFLPGLSPVAGKPMHNAFDEIERRLGIAERLARFPEDPRALQRVGCIGWPR
jgi:hypothetical protein